MREISAHIYTHARRRFRHLDLCIVLNGSEDFFILYVFGNEIGSKALRCCLQYARNAGKRKIA